MSLVIAVACEADSDFRAVSTLIDRLLVEQVGWLEADHLEYVRRYVGAEAHYAWTKIQNAPELAKARNLKPRKGHFQGEPGAADALLARKAILLLNSLNPQPDVLIFMRDIDDQPERKTGWNQARNEYHGKSPLILGIAIIKRENWVLAGFRSSSDDEQLRLQAERQTLGYDPSLNPDRVNSHAEGSKHCPKRVLTNLVGLAGVERELACLRDTPLEELETRGENIGLKQFLIEIRTIMCPMLGANQKT